MRLGRWVILIVIGSALGLWGLLFMPVKKASQLTPTRLVEESMSGVLAQRFDPQGRLLQVVTLQSWVHHKGAPASQMVAPTLRMYYPNGSLWDISAAKGEAFQTHLGQKLEKLHLSQNVVVMSLGQADKNWCELKTDNLLFFPKQSLATTEDRVVVNGPSLRIRATGLRAYLDRHYVEFIKDVKTDYANPSV